MQATLALLALAASAVSAQGIAAGTLKPTTATPAGCSQSYNGKFEITIVQAGPAKRDLVEKRQSSCSSSGILVAQLASGILTDSAGRIGGIVANRQFQFDGPPSQTGTIYNGGWSVCNNGSLAIGGNALFYQCLSGGFYNLYDRNVAAQCQQVLIEVIPCSGTATGVVPVTQSADGQPGGPSATTRRVTQISDGQVQASSAVPRPVSQFTDGQIQVTASAGPFRAPVSQIGDGQIQATSAATRAPVSQISDGQIQATSAARVTTTRAPVSQISDGQIQATSAAPRSTTTARAPVSQISDGQIQATSAATRVATTTRAPVSQISDGQIQATSVATRPATYTGAASANKVGGAVLAAGLAAALL